MKLKRFFSALFIIISFSCGYAQDSSTNTSVTLNNSSKTFGLEITTYMGDMQTFQRGDMVYFYLSHSSDAYLLLIYQDAANNLLQVFPSKTFPKTYYKAADYTLFPDGSVPFRFEISAPFGEETIWLFACNKQFPQLEGKDQRNGLRILEAKNMDLIVQKLQTFVKREKLQFGHARTSITTIEKTNEIN